MKYKIIISTLILVISSFLGGCACKEKEPTGFELFVDEHGHEPDSGTAETASSITYLFVQGLQTYAEDGYDLEITDIEQLEGDLSIYLVS